MTTDIQLTKPATARGRNGWFVPKTIRVVTFESFPDLGPSVHVDICSSRMGRSAPIQFAISKDDLPAFVAALQASDQCGEPTGDGHWRCPGWPVITDWSSRGDGTYRIVGAGFLAEVRLIYLGPDDWTCTIVRINNPDIDLPALEAAVLKMLV